MRNQQKIKELMALMKGVQQESLCIELLELLLTPTELEQLGKRFDIIKGLVQGQKTQRELSADLKLSIAKITRGSNELKRRSPLLLRYLKRFFNEERD